MKTKTVKTRPPRPRRHFPDDIDDVLHGYGHRARAVRLWRQLDGKHNEWTYLGRLHPSESEVEDLPPWLDAITDEVC